jgi:hypothetical protein
MTVSKEAFCLFLRQIRTVDIDVGIEQGQTALLLHQLEHTFGTLSDEIVTQIRALTSGEKVSSECGVRSCEDPMVVCFIWRNL